MSRTRRAAGSIKPNRFVSINTSQDDAVNQSDASTYTQVFGVSMGGSRYPSGLSSLDDGFVAIDGENVRCYCFPDTDVPIVVGSGQTVSPGDRLKPDSDGAAQVTTTDRDEYGAVATSAGTAGQIITCDLVPYGKIG